MVIEMGLKELNEDLRKKDRDCGVLIYAISYFLFYFIFMSCIVLSFIFPDDVTFQWVLIFFRDYAWVHIIILNVFLIPTIIFVIASQYHIIIDNWNRFKRYRFGVD